MEDELDDLLGPVCQVDGALDPELRLLVHAETTLLLVMPYEKRAVIQDHDVVIVDSDELAGVLNYPESLRDSGWF